MRMVTLNRRISAAALGLTCALAGVQAWAIPVQIDENGNTSAGTSSVPDPDEDDTTCTLSKINECADLGGLPDQRAQACWCNFYDWVPRRVINASDGDVGIVPIDGRGSETVTSITRAIGQFHRHAVMFYGDGDYARHSTMYMADAEDGSTSDAMGDYVTVKTPLVGKIRLDGDELANGLPGALSQTIDDAYARGRLAATGLVLKPALAFALHGEMAEVDRPLFEAAVIAARSTSGYYKLSDYSRMNSMSRPWSSSRSGDLRGSHCAGYATYFYRAQGLTLSDVTYPADLRADAADVLFNEVRDECRNATGPWQDLLAAITLHWNSCTNIANQVVNCFSDMGCDNLSNDWRDVTSGSAVSPDNMLPDSFKYSGSTDYDWDGTVLSSRTGTTTAYNGQTVSAIVRGGKTVSHPGLSGSSPTTSSTGTSPFKRVEALVYSGGYAALVDSVRL